MSNDFEPILAGLLTHITSNVTGFKSVGRRVIPWGDVNDLPALFLRLTGLDDDYSSGEGLLRRTLHCELWLYDEASTDPTVAPGIDLNSRVAAVRDCFAPDDLDTGEFTLSAVLAPSRVYRCRVEGRTIYAPGDTINRSIANIPVSILIP